MHRDSAELRGVVVINFDGLDAREAFLLYQRLAVLLYTQPGLQGVLLKCGSEEPELHYALRDIVQTLAGVAGTPLQVRVAVLDGRHTVRRICEETRSVLAPLGCDLKVFDGEGAAASWLLGKARPAAAAEASRLAPAPA